MNWDERIQFVSYIGMLREKRNVTVSQLTEGLCGEKTAKLIMQGKRSTGRPLREALLGRLGVGAEDYECYLGSEEYAQWKMQERILHCIVYEKTGQAEETLEKYHELYCEQGGGKNHSGEIERKLNRQFYLSMLAQIQHRRGKEAASREDAFTSLMEEALSLTVPEPEKKPLSKLALSVRELNLILELERCRKNGKKGLLPGERPERYREVIAYITTGRLDRRGMAKLYPKAVYFLCRCLMDEYGAEEEETDFETRKKYMELFTYCNRALEMLRDNGRMYFLWEILDMRERLFDKLEKLPGSRRGRSGGGDAFLRLRQENARWKQALENVYAQFRVTKETVDDCWLYRAKGISCTNEVIRIRSRMLGIGAGELCEGVCDIRTLYRIRNEEVSPQRWVAEGLFEKLGLSGELIRTELVTSIPEARELMERLRESMNGQRWDEAEETLEQLKQLVSMDITCNRQALQRQEVLLSLAKKEIDKAECSRRIREVLELTLPYKAFLAPGEKYLTHEEQSCIRNMMVGMDKEGEEFRICLQRFEEIYQSVIDREELENVDGMYEFVMIYVRSQWGNRGEYDKADKHSLNIIEGCLRNRRLWALHDSLYDRWWNHAERRKRGIPTDIVLDDEQELNHCILLGELAKSHDVAFYREKLKALAGNHKSG